MQLGLAVKPSIQGEEYWTRKSQYVISVLVIVDDMQHIRHAQIGWPGSVQDNHIWKNSVHHLQANDYFGPGEYLLSDSAFTNSQNKVSFYKRAGGKAILPPG